MNSVIGLTGLLLDTPLSQEQRDFAETVRKAGESLLTIINDILDFSKVEAGQMDLEQLAFAPADLVQDVVELLEPSARQRGLRLTADVAASVPAAAMSDPGRMRQVITNIVGNALKFTERGEVRILVDVEEGGGPTPQLRFRVIDTGVGMSAEVLSRLFQPFSQADSSMSRRYGGTGLGLAISDRITRLMGGRIMAESTVGQGSCFTVTFPLVPAESTSLQRAGSGRAPMGALEGGTLAHARALVVEDNPANQMVALAMLKRLGVRADHVGDGLEALEAVARVPYDVVLMDCQMPRMDGYTAARLIRERESPGRRLPIIAMTANALVGERELCLAAGMDDYLAKPVRIGELAEMLARWAGVARAAMNPDTAAVRKPAKTPDDPGLAGVLAAKDAIGEAWPDARAVFFEHSVELLGQMRAAAASGDLQELRRLAHSMRGGCDMMGGRACGALAAGIEHGVAGGEQQPWVERVEELGRAFDQLAAIMRGISGAR